MTFKTYFDRKADLFEVVCNCKNKYFVFVDTKNCYSLCLKCRQKNYEIQCQFCQAVFKFPENSKSIYMAQNRRDCPECGKLNLELPQHQIDGYKKAIYLIKNE